MCETIIATYNYVQIPYCIRSVWNTFMPNYIGNLKLKLHKVMKIQTKIIYVITERSEDILNFYFSLCVCVCEANVGKLSQNSEQGSARPPAAASQ